MQTKANLLPGDVVKVEYTTFTHYGIISDLHGEDGMPMIIDLSSATGTVSERSWHQATMGRPVTKSRFTTNLSPVQILATARKWIGKIKYSLMGFNCESFVRFVLELPRTSQQVAASAITVPSAGLVAYHLSNKNLVVTGLACLLTLALTTNAVAT